MQLSQLLNRNISDKGMDKVIQSFRDKSYKLLEVKTKKQDERFSHIYPPLFEANNVRYLYLNSDILQKCINIIASDISLGEIICDNKDIEQFWRDNQRELFFIGLDYYTYGYSPVELLFSDKKELKAIKQIPAYTTHLVRNNQALYVQQNVNASHITLQKYNEIYPKNDQINTQGIAYWIGQDHIWRYFTTPVWWGARDKIEMNNAIERLDIDNIESGNLISGILAISGMRQILPPNEKSFEERLQEQFGNAGSGLAVAYIENSNTEMPLNFEYIKLSQENWDYLGDKYATNEQKILESFQIPIERLLNNQNKQSMNVNKADTIWQIYTKALANYQHFLISFMKEINKSFFDYNGEIAISLPTFTNETSEIINHTEKLLNLGLMSKNQAIQYLNSKNLDFRLDELDGLLDDTPIPLEVLQDDERLSE